MPENEIHIPQHLIESVPSAASQERAIKREYWVDSKARSMGVPLASLENSLVSRYMNVLVDLHLDHQRGENGMLVQSAPDWIAKRKRQAPWGVLGVAQMALSAGWEPNFFLRTDAKHRLDGVANLYGLNVDYAEGSDMGNRQGAVEVGLWRRHPGLPDEPSRFVLEAETGASRYRVHEKLRAADPAFDETNREQMAAVVAEGRRLGLPDEGVRHDPLIMEGLVNVVEARQRLRDATELDGLPDAPGLRPSAKDRLMSVVAPLLRTTIMMHTEVIKPGSLSADRLAAELKPVTDRYDLVVLEK